VPIKVPPKYHTAAPVAAEAQIHQRELVVLSQIESGP
jgi:hypothetical protein